MKESTHYQTGYSAVNGLKMYYEIHGQGKPLVLIHGGGSTIQTSFGNIIPLLSKSRRVIAMELQAHGHTGDRETDLTFEQDADDVAKLLENLQINKADFLGFSNGGHTAIEMALRHSNLVDKMILASAFYKREAVVPQFWEGFDSATLEMMPQVLQEGYLKANNDKKGLLNMFTKDVQKMRGFSGWTEKQMQSITATTLIVNGNNDVGSVEHAVEMYRIIPNCELAILPGGHGTYLGAIEALPNGEWTMKYVVELIKEFLDKIQAKDKFLSLLSAPARRALEKEGITTLNKLVAYSEKEILALHGIGKSTIPKLQKILSENNLTLKIK